MDKFAQLEDRIAELETVYAETAERCIVAETRYKLSTRRMKMLGGLAACALVAVVVISPGNKALAQGYGESFSKLVADVNTLKSEMSTQENKTKYMSTSGTTTTFTACNVQIVNGLGATNGNPNDPFDFTNDTVTNGLGNLIIGYNMNVGNTETGSHNLILGDLNSYSSYGGIVDGDENTISGPYASITGGYMNSASGLYSSVSGGADNISSANGTSISGGFLNKASNFYSSVSGGVNNTASGNGATVSGGYTNLSQGDQSSVSGGQANDAESSTTSILGGAHNTATGYTSCIAAGVSNISSGNYSSCLGGYLCRSDDSYSAVLGGYNSTVKTGDGYTHFP